MTENWLLDELESASQELEQVPDWARPTFILGSLYPRVEGEVRASYGATGLAAFQGLTSG